MIKKTMVRLIADEGKLLTNGERQGKVIDVYPAEDANKWYEIYEPEEEQEDNESELIEE